jgi:hypothetical protein
LLRQPSGDDVVDSSGHPVLRRRFKPRFIGDGVAHAGYANDRCLDALADERVGPAPQPDGRTLERRRRRRRPSSVGAPSRTSSRARATKSSSAATSRDSSLHGYVIPKHRLVFRDGFANEDGTPNTELPTTTARVTIQDIGGGKTRMSIESEFPTVKAMEQLAAMGMEEGLTQAVGQIDAILAEDPVARR